MNTAIGSCLKKQRRLKHTDFSLHPALSLCVLFKASSQASVVRAESAGHQTGADREATEDIQGVGDRMTAVAVAEHVTGMIQILIPEQRQQQAKQVPRVPIAEKTLFTSISGTA